MPATNGELRCIRFRRGRRLRFAPEFAELELLVGYLLFSGAGYRDASSADNELDLGD